MPGRNSRAADSQICTWSVAITLMCWCYDPVFSQTQQQQCIEKCLPNRSPSCQSECSWVVPTVPTIPSLPMRQPSTTSEGKAWFPLGPNTQPPAVVPPTISPQITQPLAAPASQSAKGKNWISTQPSTSTSGSGISQKLTEERSNQLLLLQLLYPNPADLAAKDEISRAYLGRPGVFDSESDMANNALRLRLLQSKLLQTPLSGGKAVGQTGLSVIPVKPEDGVKYFQLAKNLWSGSNGHPQDHVIAIEMLKKSALAEYSPALYQLGKLYLSGDGVEKDAAVGQTLVRRAQQLGLSLSESELRKGGLHF